ncbi:MAG: hypothetical protein JKP98_04600 [Rhodobacteraceae bacterium]|jgi:hypothetical protein|nr:hypothetical protein [Paracoccaceae bacterium]MBL4556720.1 hypothetical protein [Paracoccaceae bacterium]HBG98235.1 hypothetical protein [Paracoccaceae bacterium]
MDDAAKLTMFEGLRPQLEAACQEGEERFQLDQLAMRNGETLRVVADPCDTLAALDRQIETLRSKTAADR